MNKVLELKLSNSIQSNNKKIISRQIYIKNNPNLDTIKIVDYFSKSRFITLISQVCVFCTFSVVAFPNRPVSLVHPVVLNTACLFTRKYCLSKIYFCLFPQF